MFLMLIFIFYLLNFKKISFVNLLILMIFLGGIVFLSINLIFDIDNQELDRLLPILNLFNGEINISSITTSRTDIWIIALEKISNNPFGSGFGSFHRLSEINLGAHNTYLMIFGESGFFPFLFFVVFVFLLFKKYSSLKKNKLNILFLLCLIIIFFQSFGSLHDGLLEKNNIFFLAFLAGFKNKLA